jgi:hypothetical protein
MKRTVVILMLTLFMALPNAAPVLGSGGNFPPDLPNTKIIGPAIHANVTIVFTNPPSATVKLRKGNLTSEKTFDITKEFPLTKGCLPEMTATRFLDKTLWNWIPNDTLVELFGGLGGIAVDPSEYPIQNGDPVPMLVSLDNAMCIPANTSGTLMFEAMVLFWYQK